MSTDIVRVDRAQLPVQNSADVFALARAFAQAHVLGARNDAEGVMALKVVMEVGIVKANETYNIMMGRLSKKASAICADFLKAGGTYRIVKRDSECAELVASYGETKEMTFRFTWEEAQGEPFVYEGHPNAQQAALARPIEKRVLKDKYKTPRSRMQMLWARVVSDMGMALCPTVCEGTYPPEVTEDFDDDPQRTPAAPMAPISEEEAARRAKNVTAEVGVAALAIPDATICPEGFGEYSGKAWAEMDDETLAAAEKAEGLTAGHKAAIRLVMDQRKEGAQ
jgi:hypothetical protein